MLSDEVGGNFPRYNISQVLNRTDKLCELLERFVGQRLVGDVYSAFVESVSAHFLSHNIGDSKCLELSARHLLGVTLDDKALNVFCWRLAGNTDELRNFRRVDPWSGQAVDEWMPVEIVDQHAVAGAKKPSISFTFRILAGSGASLLCRKVWSKKFCAMISRKLGFSRPDKKHPFKDPAQFVGLRLLALFEQGKSSVHTGPLFEKIHVQSGFVGHNKIVIAKRARTYPGFMCPVGFTHPCHLCFVGYDRCDMGTHPRTYEKRVCQSCLKESWFDPKEANNKKCINCTKLGVPQQNGNN